MKEEWRVVKDFKGYEVSTEGRIRSIDRMVESKGDYYRSIKGKILNPAINVYGYKTITIDNKRLLISRLVAFAFIYNPDILSMVEVNHIDGDKSNNCTINLEWCTSSSNIQHAIRIGLISTKAVEQFNINGEFIADYPSRAAAGRATGVSSTTISKYILGGQSSGGGYHWKSLNGSVNSIGKPVSTNHYQIEEDKGDKVNKGVRTVKHKIR